MKKVEAQRVADPALSGLPICFPAVFGTCNQKGVLFTGWWFGTCFIFPYIGNFIIPTDFHSIIFQRGRLKPPTSFSIDKPYYSRSLTIY